MTVWSEEGWLFITLAWPLFLGLLVALPPVRRHALVVLPLATLHALGLALSGLTGHMEIPDLLLGVVLAGTPAGLMLLGMTAGLWLAAGVHAWASLERGKGTATFAGFWCLTLAGNLGVFLAADVITFYVAFAAVSLAAWVLVVHERTDEALRAGRLYLVLAILGEACLLVGFLIGADAAGGMEIAAVRDALPDAPLGGLATVLLVTGFGLKAGLIPLHVWLPLAHPAAPVPASAVLSGAMVKAGLWGIVLFLPDGPSGQVLIVLGLGGAFAAALWSLSQANPKAILAYSTVSQMGVVMALAGAAVSAGTSRDVAVYYALHHGLAKGALFLVVGVMATVSGRLRLCVLGLAAVLAASVAGAPLTGGALVKAAAKTELPGLAEPALTLSSVTTTLLFVWFLQRLWENPTHAKPSASVAGGMVPTFVLALGAVTMPWLVRESLGGPSVEYVLSTSAVLGGVWPIGLALGLWMAFAVGLRLRVPVLPPGDLLMLIRPWRGGPLVFRRGTVLARDIRTLRRHAAGKTLRTILNAGQRLETSLFGWPLSGALLLGLAILTALLAA